MDIHMELTANKSSFLKAGTVGLVSCAVSLAISPHMHEATGSAGILLGWLIAAAASSWLAGRWAGLLTTGAGAIVAAYVLPPNYSFHIAASQDSGALYSFAIGGIIISLLCGAAWQLRREARAVAATQEELARLRSSNNELLWRARQQDCALRASDGMLRALAGTVLDSRQQAEEIARGVAHDYPLSFEPVDCADLLADSIRTYSAPVRALSLPTVLGDRRELCLLFDTLVSRASRNHEVRGVDFVAARLPDSWLITVTFRRAEDAPTPFAPLSELELAVCHRIVVRQGGRCWTTLTGSGGDWEIRFLLDAVR
jgi:hypothetical protein